jgi:hypothetical protein
LLDKVSFLVLTTDAFLRFLPVFTGKVMLGVKLNLLSVGA